MKRRKGGWLSNTKGCQTYAFGVGCYLMMIKTEIWLKSKGSLPVEKQQYGHWIRASQFSPVCRQFVKVKGYEMSGSQTLSRARQSEWRAQLGGDEVQPRLIRTEVIGEVEMERRSSLESAREGLISNRGSSDIIAVGSDFKAIIEGIDKEILNEGAASNQVVKEIIKELNGAGKVGVGEDVAHVDTSD